MDGLPLPVSPLVVIDYLQDLLEMVIGLFYAIPLVFTWPAFGYLILGTFIGLLFGVIPGLGGSIALILLLPLTFVMDPMHAMILFAGAIGGVNFGGSISAILLNIPGTAPNAATCLDGYPMSTQGRATEAIVLSAVSSALGALGGLVVLFLLLPLIRDILLMFSAPEFFWVAILGLAAIVVIGQGNLIKSVVAAGFGLMLSFVGYFGEYGQYRFGFGTDVLWDGFHIIVIIIGLFAIAEILHLMARGGSISTEGSAEVGGNVLEDIKAGFLAIWERPKLFLQSSFIGVIIGMIPGTGGAVANFISYSQATRFTPDPQKLGTGSPDGIIASEASNDAKTGGSLLPTLAFGIPGSVVMVVFLTAFLIHGIRPGRQLLNEDIAILYVILISILIANFTTSTVGAVLANQLRRLTTLPVGMFAPIILFVSVCAAYSINMNSHDIGFAIIFGVVGWLFIIYEYSRIALVLGFILGPIIETRYHQALQISEPTSHWFFVTRPVSLIIIALLVVTLFVGLRLQRQSGAPYDA